MDRVVDQGPGTEGIVFRGEGTDHIVVLGSFEVVVDVGLKAIVKPTNRPGIELVIDRTVRVKGQGAEVDTGSPSHCLPVSRDGTQAKGKTQKGEFGFCH